MINTAMHPSFVSSVVRFGRLNFALLTALLLSAAMPAHSAVIQWTNTAGGFWAATANWSPNVIPAAADTVMITNDGTYTVTLNATPTISTLILGGQNGTQTLFGGITINSNATIGSAGQFIVGGLQINGGMIVHGSMVWSNGTIGGTAPLTIASNGTLTLAGSGSKQLFGTIQNHGTIVASGPGMVSVSALGSLYNAADGLFDVQSQASFLGSGDSRLVNDGILRKSAGAGLPASVFTATQFTNNGIIEAQSGNITLRNVTLGENSSYLGTGMILMESGAMNGNFTSENLILNAYVSGKGILHGSMVWSNGAMGTLTITPAATLILTNSTSRTLNGNLTNDGTIVWAGGGMTVSAGVTLYNHATGLVDAQHSGNASLGGLGTPTKFIINEGTIRKSTGAGTSTIGIALHKGILDAQTGTISIGSSSPGLSAVVIGAGSSFIGAGTNYLSGSVQLEGTFISSNLVGGIVQLQGQGTLQGTALFGLHLSLMAGAAFTVTSGSTLAFREISGAILANFGFLTNAGTINLDGSALFSGNSIWHNLSGGVIDLKRNGTLGVGGSGTPTLINDGVFQKSVGAGTNTLQEGLNFINNGTVRAQTGTLLFNTPLHNPGGTLELAGGNIQCAIPLVLSAGKITGSGTLQAPSITSAGTVDPGSPAATLVLSGDYTQLLTGSIYFDLAGATPGVDQAQVIVTGTAHLNGLIRLRFSPGYAPEIGAAYPVLSAASLTGKFPFQDGFFLLGQNQRMNPAYSPTNLTVTAIAAADPAGPSLTIAADDHQAIVFWPTEFPDYSLRARASLTTANWTALPGSTNRHIEPLTEPQRFFQLVRNP